MKKFLCLLSALAFASPGRAEEFAAPLGVTRAEPVTETVCERDAAGVIRVQREVRQNRRGDYVNHGVWRTWDASGKLAGQGRYESGKPAGLWSRWATAEDTPSLAADHFAGFTGPFLSQANYRDGQLDGVWSIFDASGKRVSEVHFVAGQRDGFATLWTSAGEVSRRSQFAAGLPTGVLQSLDESGELVTTAQFEAGRERIEHTEHHDNGRLKAREGWLSGLQRPVVTDDPWRLRLAQYEPSGPEVRSGVREAWWPNGQPKLQTEYRLGKAVGEARWWHENGQLALSGNYDSGLASGEWNWWRENGMRAAACRFNQGKPAGEWSLWATDGQRQPTASSNGRLVQRPTTMLVR
ncbi:MORN repeat variant [Planctomycetes bacterium K2D]|uniref:MORN repeat variant n=1 Tax=Botrimarina mediterranea TaxID=2528022 RepID=A0A518KA99_9BACT|nr:MORN repeat variant [Botrimarina mediterranea]QDV79356.1 MORN repeat variant [Planctomycetes bacterium K2D]